MRLEGVLASVKGRLDTPLKALQVALQVGEIFSGKSLARLPYADNKTCNVKYLPLHLLPLALALLNILFTRTITSSF